MSEAFEVFFLLRFVFTLSFPVSLCIQIMTERKNAKAMAGGSLQDRIQAGLDLPLQGRFAGLGLGLGLGWRLQE